jgi:hypothetical protein
MVDEKDVAEVEKIKPEDVAYTLGTAVVGLVPGAAEILSLLFASPIEQRRTRLLYAIVEKIKFLEENRGISVDELRNNEEFIDAVLQVMSYSFRTSEEEKIKAFQNAIANIGLHISPEKTICQIFLTLIDRFTPLHLRVLDFYNNPREWFLKNGKTLPKFEGSASIVNSFLSAFPEHDKKFDLIYLIWSDLQNNALVERHVELRQAVPSDGLISPRSTSLGRLFIDFISEPSIA